MAIETTYTVKIRSGEIWQFKYNLNGVLIFFNVMEGDLTEKQEKFLYQNGKFPFKEIHLKDWEKLYPPTKVEILPPDFSFEALWNLYDNKVKKFEAEKSFKKLKEPDVIKCFMAIKGYNMYLGKKSIAKAHLSTFINQRYFEDEWSKA